MRHHITNKIFQNSKILLLRNKVWNLPSYQEVSRNSDMPKKINYHDTSVSVYFDWCGSLKVSLQWNTIVTYIINDVTIVTLLRNFSMFLWHFSYHVTIIWFHHFSLRYIRSVSISRRIDSVFGTVDKVVSWTPFWSLASSPNGLLLLFWLLLSKRFRYVIEFSD